jgi:Histidine kinase-, DNA gyrase B-, and HSP90-like ATPase
MSSSIRYTQSGGVLISIRPANGLGEDGGLNIEVWDTGIGIPLADQARVFEPYVQLANKERDREKGLGLGLSIVKGTAAALGFSISIRSTVGKGAIFKINVPRSFCKINRLPPKPREPLSQAIVEQRPSPLGARISAAQATWLMRTQYSSQTTKSLRLNGCQKEYSATFVYQAN